jgi:uncharacterized protein YjbJ (UPF0337 family)
MLAGHEEGPWHGIAPIRLPSSASWRRERATFVLSGCLARLIPHGQETRMASGTADKAKGAVKEAVGKVTGHKRTEAEGKTDQVKGKVKNAADDVAEKAKGARDSLKKE